MRESETSRLIHTCIRIKYISIHVVYTLKDTYKIDNGYKLKETAFKVQYH